MLIGWLPSFGARLSSCFPSFSSKLTGCSIVSSVSATTMLGQSSPSRISSPSSLSSLLLISLVGSGCLISATSKSITSPHTDLSFSIYSSHDVSNPSGTLFRIRDLFRRNFVASTQMCGRIFSYRKYFYIVNVSETSQE